MSITITNAFLAFKTLFYMLILFHTLANAWIYIGEKGWRETYLFDHQVKDPWPIYANAFYFVVTTATTIGYGDINGTTLTEEGFCMFLQFLGIIVFSGITGNIRRLQRAPKLQDVIQERVQNVE